MDISHKFSLVNEFSFTHIMDTTRDPLAMETNITLHLKIFFVAGDLKDDQLEECCLKDLIQFISYPISRWIDQTIEMEKPIWITKEVNGAFTNDRVENLAVKLFSVEGQLEFKAILFVPKKTLRTSEKGPFGPIDICEELIPEYLSFVKGIVDLEDLSLNILREMSQQNKLLKVIRKNLVKKRILLFSKIAKYEDKFCEATSKNLKSGILEDSQNMTKLAELMRYHSTGLRDYVIRMEGQNDIFYITGESKKAVENSSFLEKLENGYGDLYAVGQLKELEGKKTLPAAKECMIFDESEDETKKTEKLKENSEGFHIKDVLGDKVVDSACCLVTDEYGWSTNMKGIMKARTLRDSSMAGYMYSKKTMEINPRPIMDFTQEQVNEGLGSLFARYCFAVFWILP